MYETPRRALKGSHESPNFLYDRSTDVRDHLSGIFHCTEEDSWIQKSRDQWSGALIWLALSGIPLILARRAALPPSLPAPGLYPSAVARYPGWAGLLRMCRSCIPCRKCLEGNPLHVLLIQASLALIPWPELAGQTQTTAKDNTKAHGLTKGRVPSVTMSLFTHSRDGRVLQSSEENGIFYVFLFFSIWPKIDGVKS